MDDLKLMKKALLKTIKQSPQLVPGGPLETLKILLNLDDIEEQEEERKEK